MAYEISYEKDLGYMKNKHSGQITFSEIKEMYSNLLALAAEKKCTLFFSDFREVLEGKITITEIYSLPKVFNQIAKKNNINVHECINAILIPEENYLFQFFVTVSNNFAQTNIKLFLDEEEAITWLLRRRKQ